MNLKTYIENLVINHLKYYNILLGYEVNRLDKIRIPIAEARIKAINFGIFNVFQEKKTDDNSSDPKK